MFKPTINTMKQMNGITASQAFRITPRRGASSDVTGVDVLYMTNFSRGTCLFCSIHICPNTMCSNYNVCFTCRPSCFFSHARLSAACLGKLLHHIRTSGATTRFWHAAELSATSSHRGEGSEGQVALRHCLCEA